MQFIKHRSIGFALAFGATVSAAARAFAHHGMHGRMPATFAEGLLSGLAHPVIGLDHLFAVVALGLVAAVLPAGFSVPATFVFATVLGTGVHLMGLGLPATESVVALSVSAFGAALILSHALTRSRSFALVAVAMLVAGVAHGYAYGESIVGAEPTPVGAYLLGFVIVQLAVAAGAQAAARAFLQRRPEAQQKLALRLSGAVFVLAGSIWVVSAAGA